jgi:hypothetical protein
MVGLYVIEVLEDAARPSDVDCIGHGVGAEAEVRPFVIRGPPEVVTVTNCELCAALSLISAPMPSRCLRWPARMSVSQWLALAVSLRRYVRVGHSY